MARIGVPSVNLLKSQTYSEDWGPFCKIYLSLRHGEDWGPFCKIYLSLRHGEDWGPFCKIYLSLRLMVRIGVASVKFSEVSDLW